ncbi:MAG: 4Fe-4S dicluster domain-containing protein [Alphaproteobacteria bacterium]
MAEESRSRVIPEWNSPDLEYVEPTQVVRSFGYDIFSGPYDEEAVRHDQKTIECVLDVDGPVNETKTAYDSPEAAARDIKEKARALGATLVGITGLDPFHVYKGHDVPHANVVMIAVPMEYDEIRFGATPRHVREVLRVYAEAGAIATRLGAYIREQGYPARAHSLRFEQINMLPHARAAGLGELGKHGSLINRELGCSFRVAAVTTDLPAARDSVENHGVEDLCANCNMCVTYCPGDAISHQKEEVRGITKWVVDTAACAPYWGSYNACGICLEVCPFNARGFDGRYKKTFVETIKGIDLGEWREELKAGLQEPWAYVEKPESREEGWRNYVEGKGEAGFMIQGLPREGLAAAVYERRRAMKIDPQHHLPLGRDEPPGRAARGAG